MRARARRLNGWLETPYMHAEFRKQLLTALWPEGQSSATDVFAILDGARDARIVRRIEDYRDKKACLYEGPLTQGLMHAAPHVVRLFRDDGFCRTLLEDGWGQSWGVFVRAEVSLPSLRRHLRKFLVVQGPQGQRLIFRWYDPRVLRVYLPTCSTEELRTVFGPVSAFLVEGSDAGTMHQFGFDGQRLTETRKQIA
jgi:hypothetical protein